MIYTVTFNPSLDYIVSVEDFKLGMTNRTASELILPGGKGINVSTVLKNLGIANKALGFSAGFTGAEIEKRLCEMGVCGEFIRLEQGLSRINLKLKSTEGTEINGMGPEIGQIQSEKLMKRLEQLEEGDVLFLAGSIPASMEPDAYEKILERLEGKGVLTVVDAAGELLTHVLKYKPFLIKPNNHELGELFGATLSDRQSVIPYARRLQEMGAENVLVSMAGEGAVLLTGDGRVLQTAAPKGHLKNGVGAGDSMVAGFMAGWLERKDYRHAFKMGVAAGSASAFSEYLAEKEEIEAVYRQIEDIEEETIEDRGNMEQAAPGKETKV